MQKARGVAYNTQRARVQATRAGHFHALFTALVEYQVRHARLSLITYLSTG